MNKIEEFYKEAGGVEYDKFDKKAPKFTYYDMIGFADSYHSKQLIIADVSQQRELLCEYTRHLKKQGTLTKEQSEIKLVDKFISHNCG